MTIIKISKAVMQTENINQNLDAHSTVNKWSNSKVFEMAF
jgi:hypothetical protein